jgi:hypothetical protein
MLPSIGTSVSISESANNVCEGTPVTFTAFPVNGGSTPSYQWQVNGLNTGSNNVQFASSSLKNKDSVSVKMTSSASCSTPLTSTSNKIGMTIKPLVTPKVTISASANNICPGELITFTATDSNGGTTPKHTWLRFGIPVGIDSTGFTYSIVSSGAVQCVLTSNVACASKTKDTATFNVLVRPSPVKPLITRDWDTLFSTIAPSYQWLINNAPISGATNRKLTVTQNGTFKVTVDSNGCKTTSDAYLFSFMSISEIKDNTHISLVPNPTDGLLKLSALFNEKGTTTVQITDMAGKEIQHIQFGDESVLNNQEIDIRPLNGGSYLFFVRHIDQLSVFKIIRID